jgi:GTPase-associated system-like protein
LVLARANLQKQAVEARDRQELDWEDFDALENETGNPPNFAKQLLPALKELFQGLEQQRKSDREELEVLWWLYNGRSEKLGKQLKGMSAFLAATAIGCELADRITTPATAGLGEMVTQAAVRDRTLASIKPKPIAKIITELGEPGRKLLVPAAEHVRKFTRATGTLLPLTWLCIRLEESHGAAGWETEFLSTTGIKSDQELAPDALAGQVFAERQAQQVYRCLVKGTA